MLVKLSFGFKEIFAKGAPSWLVWIDRRDLAWWRVVRMEGGLQD